MLAILISKGANGYKGKAFPPKGQKTNKNGMSFQFAQGWGKFYLQESGRNVLQATPSLGRTAIRPRLGNARYRLRIPAVLPGAAAGKMALKV